MTTVVEISDTEDTDDCVIKSVTYIVGDEEARDLYKEVCKENKLLADFVQKCLLLENTISMFKIMKEELLQKYYDADKTARKSPKFQKSLKRANHLLHTEPSYKFTNIKNLCNILETLRVKKRVPFVTLTTNAVGCADRNSRSDRQSKRNELKRSSKEVINCPNKIAKPNKNNGFPFFETTTSSYNDTCHSSYNDTCHSSFNDSCDSLIASLDLDASKKSVIDKDKLFMEKKNVPVLQTSTDKRLKIIENTITHYQKVIAELDEQEVDEDSINSPYLKSERLKLKIVSLYKERCQLLGSQTVKHKGIRLKPADGHPPGPTRVLERFLNKNCNKDGDPPFPDFCDVVNCVTEANEKYDLGWNKAQIMNEACGLFTSCGKLLQKRRQHREYRDLLWNVKLEDLHRDPADEDPTLEAKLEQNRRIAVKKESEILERYTMMQVLPPKAQKKATATENTGNENIESNVTVGTQQESLKNINIHAEEHKLTTTATKFTENKNIVPDSNENVEKHESRNTLFDNKNNTFIDCSLKVDTDVEESVPSSTLSTNDGTRMDVEHSSDVTNKPIRQGVIVNYADYLIKSLNKHNTSCNTSSNKSICNNNEDLEKCTLNQNEILHVESIESEVKHKAEEDVMAMFQRWGDKFTVTVEIINDS